MGYLIEDLLKYSRLGRKAIKPETVSLGKVIDITIETLSDQIRETNVRINLPEQMPSIQGDSTLASHIFINLYSDK